MFCRAVLYPIALAMDLLVSLPPPNPYVEGLTPKVAVFGDRGYKEELRLNEVICMGP